ncbi:hypothetical protein [Leucobacter japonicus]|uniref:hypothetical protein n=1 Tax=Leucobacter japonicus TaxID=1461259 RepID=UPI000AFB3195|nr:hypothetical protein [Leucobacter japonicus]
MKITGGFLYEDQAAAEKAAAQRRGDLFDLVDELEKLNEAIDSVKLARFIEEKKALLSV